MGFFPDPFAKEDVSDDFHREVHHVLMDVTDFTIFPGFERTPDISKHCPCKSGDVIVAERGLKQTSLPAPEGSLARQNTLAQKGSAFAQINRLDEVLMVCDEDEFDILRTAEDVSGNIYNPHATNITVLTHEAGEIIKLVPADFRQNTEKKMTFGTGRLNELRPSLISIKKFENPDGNTPRRSEFKNPIAAGGAYVTSFGMCAGLESRTHGANGHVRATPN